MRDTSHRLIARVTTLASANQAALLQARDTSR
jgi:hypothetical protein